MFPPHTYTWPSDVSSAVCDSPAATCTALRLTIVDTFVGFDRAEAVALSEFSMVRMRRRCTPDQLP